MHVQWGLKGNLPPARVKHKLALGPVLNGYCLHQIGLTVPYMSMVMQNSLETGQI